MISHEMVPDMRSMMMLLVIGLTRQSSKGKIAMIIGYMVIASLMIHIYQLKVDQLRDREEFKNKRAKARRMSPRSNRVM